MSRASYMPKNLAAYKPRFDRANHSRMVKRDIQEAESRRRDANFQNLYNSLARAGIVPEPYDGNTSLGTGEGSPWKTAGAILTPLLLALGAGLVAMEKTSGDAKASNEVVYPPPQKILEEDKNVDRIDISYPGKELVYVKWILSGSSQELIKLNLETKQKTKIDTADIIGKPVFDSSGNIFYSKSYGSTHEIKEYNPSGQIKTLVSTNDKPIWFLDSKNGKIFYQLRHYDSESKEVTMQIFYLKEPNPPVLIKEERYPFSQFGHVMFGHVMWSVNSDGTKLAYTSGENRLEIISQNGDTIKSLQLNNILSAKFGYGKLVATYSTDIDRGEVLDDNNWDLFLFNEDGTEGKSLGRMSDKPNYVSVYDIEWKNPDEISFIEIIQNKNKIKINLKRIVEHTQFTVATDKANNYLGIYDHEWFGNKLYYTNGKILYFVDTSKHNTTITPSQQTPSSYPNTTIAALAASAGVAGFAYYLRERSHKSRPRKSSMPPPLVARRSDYFHAPASRLPLHATFSKGKSAAPIPKPIQPADEILDFKPVSYEEESSLKNDLEGLRVQLERTPAQERREFLEGEYGRLALKRKSAPPNKKEILTEQQKALYGLLEGKK